MSCSSLWCALHPQPLWVQDVTETCAMVAVESTWEPWLSLLHHHHSLQQQKPAHTGCKHIAKVNFSNPALCSETVQNPTVLEICFPVYQPGSRCAECIQTEEKCMLAPKTLLQGLLDHTLALLQPFQTNDVFLLHLRITLKRAAIEAAVVTTRFQLHHRDCAWNCSRVKFL